MTGPRIRSSLAPGEIAEIKQQLWTGVAKQDDIALAYHVTQSTVSRVLSGAQGASVPWPDGSLGGMTQERKLSIYKERRTLLQRASSEDTTLSSRLALSVAEQVAQKEATEAQRSDEKFAEQIKMKPKKENKT